MKLKDNDLPTEVIKWIINAVNPNATVNSIERLKGSTSSTLHSISLQVNQSNYDVVLRQFDNKKWLQEEPDLAFHEAESLRFAADVEVPTPSIIAFDEGGIVCGNPLVLMTKLDGAVDILPANMDHWVRELAHSLVKIHAVDTTDFQWTYFTYNDKTKLEVPSWSKVPDVWQKAIDIVKGPQPTVSKQFIHRDYHPTNVLWKNNKVSGVVDWVNACYGPAGIDVGHCRLNLVKLYGVQVADQFLSAYLSLAGETYTYDVYWDILSVMDGGSDVYPGWEVFGVKGLTDGMMEKRLDTYLKSLINRLVI
ncbi:aminoglycoside phosphotransferase family protein [Virgibacillus necropolis]|uniref:phosphotransferase family protein n=1 Tax=Virgibacillus necropolis TaxID=163877 RepID=UPI00384CC0A2